MSNIKPIKGVFEDWDGEMVLGDKREFESIHVFEKEAAKHVSDTRGESFPIINIREDVVYFIRNGEEWVDELEDGQLGEGFEVYRVEIDYNKEEAK